MKLQNARIRNFRSIKSQDIEFGETTILFGKNDSGKTNIVKALEFAFDRSRQIDISDVHVSPSQLEPKETVVVVDLRFAGDLNDYQWLLAFGEEAFNTEPGGGMSLSFRTEARYDIESRVFKKERFIINDWTSNESGLSRFPVDLLDAIDFILLDAHRDIAALVRDRYSRWNQEIAKADVSDSEAEAVEEKLAELGKSIVSSSQFLSAAQSDLKGSTDHPASKVEIAPVARSLNELYRSLDVIVTEGGGPGISMSLFGSGTRSRAEFMAFKTLASIAEMEANQNRKPYLCLAVFEEPEAHIHPQSQQQLLMQLKQMGTQRVVTTHSPYLLSKAPMDSLVQVKREGFVTTITPVDVELTDEQKKDTERYLLRSRGELFFADVVIFSEGETEERALPIFFERYYGKKPFELGVVFASVAGHNYEPYLRIASKLDIPWLILSDAEQSVLRSIKKQIGRIFNEGQEADLDDYPQIVICSPDNNFERELISDGYAEEMISAINAFESSDSEIAVHGDVPYFDNWMQKTNGNTKQRKKTNNICDKCGQNIFEEEPYDFSGEDGRSKALVDFLSDKNKVRYAAAIAEKIVSISDENRSIPSCVKVLFNELEKVLRIPEVKDDD